MLHQYPVLQGGRSEVNPYNIQKNVPIPSGRLLSIVQLFHRFYYSVYFGVDF